MHLQNIDENLQHEMDEILEEMKKRHGWIERDGYLYKKGTKESPDMLSEVFHSILLRLAIVLMAVSLIFFNASFYQALGLQGEAMQATSSTVVFLHRGLFVVGLILFIWSLVRVVVNNYFIN